MTDETIRVGADWLALREGPDAAARSRELVERVRQRLPASGELLVHDLACGTGAMGRWLAPLLGGPQRWVLHDRDPELLRRAAADPPGAAADGTAVAAETRRSDITRLGPGELAGASLVTASALLDMLTADDLARLVDVCGGAGCPVLLALSVVGETSLDPADPLDARLQAAFNGHQRREIPEGRLLGPDAADAAAAAFRGRGAEVLARPSPWRLGPPESDLAAAWLAGWVRAACEQEPALAAEAAPYARRRLAAARTGGLTVTVGHADLLVLP